MYHSLTHHTSASRSAQHDGGRVERSPPLRFSAPASSSSRGSPPQCHVYRNAPSPVEQSFRHTEDGRYLIALTLNRYLITLGCVEHIHGSAASELSRRTSPPSSPLSFPTISSSSSPNFAPWGSALHIHAWSSPMCRSRNGLTGYEGGPRHLRRRRSSFFDDKEGLSYCALLGYTRLMGMPPNSTRGISWIMPHQLQPRSERKRIYSK